jgi:hypothetical protein
MNPLEADVPSQPGGALRLSQTAVRICALVRSHALALTITALCAGALLWQAREYMPFFVDDSFISLRYAWRLLHGHGLTWTDGERVEGYSDLLWVLLVAVGGLFSKGLIPVGRTLGVSATVLTILAVVHAYRPKRLVDALPALVGGLAIVLTGPVVAWSIGGLEQPLLTALVAWATVLAYRLAEGRAEGRTASLVGVLLGLAAITRPDAALFAVTTSAALLLVTRFDSRVARAVFRMVVIASCFALAQLIFRRVYYGAWLPNTAHVKLALTAARVSQGWEYVGGAEPYLRSLVVLALAAAAVAMTDRTSRRRVAIPLASLVAWTAYVVVIGGDISPARRHLVVSIVLLAMVTAEGVHVLARRGAGARVLAAAVAAFALVMLARAQRDDPEKKHAIDDTWVWTGRDVGRFLSRAFAREKPLVAVDAAGTLPYFAPELPCLDMLGLNDRVIANIHPPDFGTGFVGHELGNGDYILSRKPDLIAFHNSLGDEAPAWRGGKEMKLNPDFVRLYQFVTFEAPGGVRTRLWVRREDGRIGVQRNEGEVVVPGYLFVGPTSVVADMDSAGRVGLRIDDGNRAFFRGVSLPPGRWSARVEASGDIEVSVAMRRWQATADGSPPDEIRFEVGEESVVSILVVAQHGKAHLRRALFQRTPD